LVDEAARAAQAGGDFGDGEEAVGHDSFSSNSRQLFAFACSTICNNPLACESKAVNIAMQKSGSLSSIPSAISGTVLLIASRLAAMRLCRSTASAHVRMGS